jgi:hypothetical protein
MQVVLGSPGGMQKPPVQTPLWQSLAWVQCEPAGEPEIEPPEPPVPVEPPPDVEPPALVEPPLDVDAPPLLEPPVPEPPVPEPPVPDAVPEPDAFAPLSLLPQRTLAKSASAALPQSRIDLMCAFPFSRPRITTVAPNY